MKKIILIVLVVLVLTAGIVSAARLPTVGGDSGTWGDVLNAYLNVSHNSTGHLNDDIILSNQIINGTIADIDISDTTNLTLGEKITFTLGEAIDNLVDSWIRVTGNTNITNNLYVGEDINFTGLIYGNGSQLTGLPVVNIFNQSLNTTDNVAFNQINITDIIRASNWSNISITETQISDLQDYRLSTNNTFFGNLTITNGNLTADYLFGDGSQLTGISGGIWTNVSGVATYEGDANVTQDLIVGNNINLSGNINTPTSFYIGNQASVAGTSSIAIGNTGTKASNNYDTAIGAYDAVANGSYSLAIGVNPISSAASSVAIGRDTEARASSATAVGHISEATGAASAAFGYYSRASNTNALALGPSTQASGTESIAIGREAVGGIGSGDTTAIAIGYKANALQIGTTAIGDQANASGDYSQALGWGAKASHTDAVALGKSAVTNAANEFKIGSPTDPLNINITGKIEPSVNNSYDLGTSTARWATTYTVTLDQLSERKFKKNIQEIKSGEYNSNEILGKIKNTSLYNFQFNWEENEKQKHIGVIADEAPIEILGRDQTGELTGGVDLGNYVGFLHTGLKELALEVEDLEKSSKEIDKLTEFKDTVGQATVSAGDKEVEVKFKQRYDTKPIVTATPIGLNIVYYGISDITISGFKIQINQPQLEDVTFNWHAFVSSTQEEIDLNETKEKEKKSVSGRDNAENKGKGKSIAENKTEGKGNAQSDNKTGVGNAAVNQSKGENNAQKAFKTGAIILEDLQESYPLENLKRILNYLIEIQNA
jgi:predicted acyltransferase (DUF342 family)